MKNLVLPLFAFLLSCFSCGSYSNHVTSSYREKAKPSDKLAIVPVRFTYTGSYTRKMTDDKKMNMEDQASKKFQKEIAAGIVRKMGTSSSGIRVNLQDINTTNAKLKEKGLSIHDTYDMSPKELGEILNVDAVILIDIESNQFFSQFEAEVIETGVAILKTVFKKPNIIDIAGIKTGDVKTFASIVDTHDESLLWTVGKSIETRVAKTPEETIAVIKRKLVHLFPYRNYDFEKK